MQKNTIYSFIEFLQYVEKEMNLTVQKFSFEPKDIKIWIINKLESKDGFILRTEDKEYFYLDFTKEDLILSKLGDSDIVHIVNLKLSEANVFENLKENIKANLINYEQK